ncbi:MAG TPA: type II toxin-antitoxin system VapC family toxin [Xanthobacteraceae bacterium]|nr:type II toxin-antitoxin system VapC family toxin [Xanthobacteraceae bacterium]
MIVLDTNVLSETLRPKPADSVRRWIEAQPSTSLFTTTICEAEILYGIALMPAGRRRNALAQVVAGIFGEDFSGRILPFDSAAARAYAEIAATRRGLGRPMGGFDAQIAAITRSRGASLATRNVGDFADCGITIVTPWEE